MDRKTAVDIVNKRLSSEAFRNAVLADLFYNGKTLVDPQCPDTDFNALEDNQVQKLAFNVIKRPIKRKITYLLARPYSVKGTAQAKDFTKNTKKLFEETARELYKKGEVWWEYVPNPQSAFAFDIVLRQAQTIAPRYINREKTEYDAVGYLWDNIDSEDKLTRYVDIVDSDGRTRANLSTDVPTEILGHAEVNGNPKVFSRLPFIKLTSDGFYEVVSVVGEMYARKYEQADTLLEDYAEPIGVITNASETDLNIVKQDLKRHKLIRVEGTGGFAYASKASEYTALESFMKMLKSDINDQMGVVTREQETSYITSGKAIDRLYIDMDNDAEEMGKILLDAMKDFFDFAHTEAGKPEQLDFDIAFNIDKTTDESAIIANIVASENLLSLRTRLEQHTWVEDVDEELKRISEERAQQPTQPTVEQLEEVEDVDDQNNK